MAKINSIGNETSELTINDAYSLPTTVGTANKVLATDGAGHVSWQTQATGTKLTYEDVTEATKNMETNHCYAVKSSVMAQLTLPVTSAKDDIIQIVGMSGGWELLQNADQTIYFGAENTVIGTAGRLSSDNFSDCITLCCVEANKKWRAFTSWGSFYKYYAQSFTASSVSTSLSFSIAMKADGTCWGWGYNEEGRLGDGTTILKKSPVAVIGGHSFVNVFIGESFTIAMKADGTCWGWGRNSSRELGDGTTTNRSSPVAVLGSHSFISIITGKEFTIAHKANGTVWSWGYNLYGRLGDGTSSNRASPVPVTGGHYFVEIAGTLIMSTIARKADGTLWAWGYNPYGQLGDGTTTSRSSPVAVLGSHSFVSVHGGYMHFIAMKADGTLWGFGSNNDGELGDGTTTSRYSPVAVVGGHSFIEILNSPYYSTMARKADGTVWSWGRNNIGQLGNGTADKCSSPVTVLGGHSFVNVAANASFAIAIKSDGTLWGWGDNTYGQLGDGTTTSRSSPTMVIGSHSFISISCGINFAIAKKADGTLWGWGYNTGGQLGDTSLANRSSPVIVLEKII